jgi:hypothetical protein
MSMTAVVPSDGEETAEITAGNQEGTVEVPPKGTDRSEVPSTKHALHTTVHCTVQRAHVQRPVEKSGTAESNATAVVPSGGDETAEATGSIQEGTVEVPNTSTDRSGLPSDKQAQHTSVQRAHAQRPVGKCAS